MSSLMAILSLFSFPGILFTRIVKDGGVIAVNDCIDTNNNTPGFAMDNSVQGVHSLLYSQM